MSSLDPKAATPQFAAACLGGGAALVMAGKLQVALEVIELAGECVEILIARGGENVGT